MLLLLTSGQLGPINIVVVWEKSWYNRTKAMNNKSIEEILNFTIEESIHNYEDTEQGNYIARYELLMLDIIVGLIHGYWVVKCQILSLKMFRFHKLF